jgi:L-ascorbate 6-phosphate lactonase
MENFWNNPEIGDGRGVMISTYLNQNRPIDRNRWLQEVFPEWGTYLNKQIDNTEVEPKTFALWWFGGASWAMKTPAGAVFLIDNFAGPSQYSEYSYCGVCRQTGAPSLEWLRLNPHVVDPWAFKRVDALLCTHHHQDHCDIYTLKALIPTTTCKFVGPKVTAAKMRSLEVPEERLIEVKLGDMLKFADAEIHCLYNYDPTAARTGSDNTNAIMPLADVAVSYLIKTEAGSVVFLGDTLYSNAYAAVGAAHQVDVAIMDMGHQAPGQSDKMSPFDVYRIADALNAKVVIPDHYDNWTNSQMDPGQLEWVVQQNKPQLRTVIMQWGGRFIYPDDMDTQRYHYPDYRERFKPIHSWEYGDIAAQSSSSD